MAFITNNRGRVVRMTNPESFKAPFDRTRKLSPVTYQNNAEGASSSSFEPGVLGLLLFSLFPFNRTRKCSHIRKSKKHGGCPRFVVGTWVFGLLLTLLFSSPSSIHRNYSTALIAVQPSFSAFRCKALNIFIKMCYSLPCTLAQSSEPCSPATRSFLLPH